MWKRRRAGGPLDGKLTCMWEDGVCLGVKATAGDHRGDSEERVAHKNGPKEDCERKNGNESNLEMIVAAWWRKKEDDAKKWTEKVSKKRS